MEELEVINQYDVVEIILVPKTYEGIIQIGDIGTVVEKYDDENFEVECVQPGGSCNWLVTLNIQSIRLKSRDPFRRWAEETLAEKSITKPSMILGAAIGSIFGALTGGGVGALTGSLNGVLIGLIIGLIIGALTGMLSAALTVKVAGTAGGIGVGYFTGMISGGGFGAVLGILIHTSWLQRLHTESVPVLDMLMAGRFETASSLSFLLSILGAVVGVWVSGKNLAPRNLKERYRP